MLTTESWGRIDGGDSASGGRVPSRLRWFSPRRHPPVSHHRALQQLDDTRIVLEQAREIVAQGWDQGRWYTAAPGSEGRRTARSNAPGAPPHEVVRACLVGAVAVVVRARDPRADLVTGGGPAIDHVWDAIQETAGSAVPGVAGRAWPREARVQRFRDVVRWNDDPARRYSEVVALLDLAVSRVIMLAVCDSAEHRTAVRS